MTETTNRLTLNHFYRTLWCLEQQPSPYYLSENVWEMDSTLYPDRIIRQIFCIEQEGYSEVEQFMTRYEGEELCWVVK